MAWSAGAPTADATAASRDGIRNGERRCARHSMNCATRLSPLTEQEGAKLFKDVWAARDGYIDVILDRSEESVERFLRRITRRTN